MREREKFAVIVIGLVLVFCYGIFLYNPKEQNIQGKNRGNYTSVRQTVVIDKSVYLKNHHTNTL
jgi:hypothetical protein